MSQTIKDFKSEWLIGFTQNLLNLDMSIKLLVKQMGKCMRSGLSGLLVIQKALC